MLTGEFGLARDLANQRQASKWKLILDSVSNWSALFFKIQISSLCSSILDCILASGSNINPFSIEPSAISSLNRSCKINKTMNRFILLRNSIQRKWQYKGIILFENFVMRQPVHGSRFSRCQKWIKIHLYHDQVHFHIVWIVLFEHTTLNGTHDHRKISVLKFSLIF